MKKFLLMSLVVLGSFSVAEAQGCSVCTKTAAGMDDKSARGLNGGIVYLAFLPITIICTVGFLWWRSKGQNG
jgi:hypothetical protein